MGDTGSMFIGYMLAAIAILGAVKTAATIALIVPAVALGLPIMDTAFAILRRYSNGKPIFQPDKGHLHHRLLALGLTQKQAVLLMYAISIILSLGAFVLAMANVYVAAAVIVVIVIAVTVVLIVHDFAIIDVLRMIDLPKDNTTITSHTQAIAQGSTQHLLLGEIAIGHDSTTEMTVSA